MSVAYNTKMPPNPYESPRPLPGENGPRPLGDGRWSLTLTGLFAGGYVGAWFGSLSGAGVGVLFALAGGTETFGLRDPAFDAVELFVTTGLLFAILGTISGGGLGAALGLVLGALVALGKGGLRQAFIWISCGVACLAAMGLATTLLRLDAEGPPWRPFATGEVEWVVHVAAICVVGVGGFFGGGLLGRILREIAWEPGVRPDIAADDSSLTMN